MKGLTLIEAVIYLALLTLLMLGCVSLSYGTSATTEADSESLLVTEEGAFVISKLTYAARQAAEIEEPRSGTNDELTLLGVNEAESTVVRLHAGTIEMKSGEGEFVPLTARLVTSLSFQREDTDIIVRFSIESREFATVLRTP